MPSSFPVVERLRVMALTVIFYLVPQLLADGLLLVYGVTLVIVAGSFYGVPTGLLERLTITGRYQPDDADHHEEGG